VSVCLSDHGSSSSIHKELACFKGQVISGLDSNERSTPDPAAARSSYGICTLVHVVVWEALRTASLVLVLSSLRCRRTAQMLAPTTSGSHLADLLQVSLYFLQRM
jgi:hypothetical protein